ncbi:MAG: VOC family protein [Bacteroidota bacterium]
MDLQQNLQVQAKLFLTDLFQEIKLQGIDVQYLELDHICYRVETTERYEALKEELLEIGELLVESEVGGRSIATFRLHEALIFEDRKIEILELPAPKPNNHYREGFEHIEFVISEDFETFMNRYAHCEFDTKGMKKVINPEIRLSFGERSVKFHHQSLEEVIAFEKKFKDES